MGQHHFEDINIKPIPGVGVMSIGAVLAAGLDIIFNPLGNRSTQLANDNGIDSQQSNADLCVASEEEGIVWSRPSTTTYPQMCDNSHLTHTNLTRRGAFIHPQPPLLYNSSAALTTSTHPAFPSPTFTPPAFRFPTPTQTSTPPLPPPTPTTTFYYPPSPIPTFSSPPSITPNPHAPFPYHQSNTNVSIKSLLAAPPLSHLPSSPSFHRHWLYRPTSPSSSQSPVFPNSNQSHFDIRPAIRHPTPSFTTSTTPLSNLSDPPSSSTPIANASSTIPTLQTSAMPPSNSLSSPPAIQSTSTSSSKASFNCHFCPRNFSLKGNMMRHMETHSTDNPKCNYCSKSFTTRGGLTRHINSQRCQMLYSSEPRPRFHCHLCTKSFVQKRHLADHIKTHTAEKPKCNYCSKSFSTRDAVNKHINNGCCTMYRYTEPPNNPKCDYCGKSFTARGAVTKHIKNQQCPMLLNAEPRPRLNCHLCPKTFFTKYLLKDHISRHHPTVTE